MTCESQAALQYNGRRVTALPLLAVVAVLPLTASLGTYLLPLNVLGVNLYAFRVLVLLLLVLTPLSVCRFDWGNDCPARLYVLLGWWWLVWGGLSIYWSPDNAAAVKEVLQVAFGFAVAVVLLNLRSYTLRGIAILRRGWVLAFLATAAVALWELQTGNHLPAHYTRTAPTYLLENVRIVLSTFGHPNNYCAFLILCFPFLLWSLVRSKRLGSRLAYGAALAALPLLVVMTGSRVGVLAFLVQVLAWGALRGKGLRVLAVYLISASVAVLFLALTMKSDLLVVVKFVRLFTGEIQIGGSTVVRLNLTRNGLWYTMTSYGLGVGAGGFEYMTQTGFGPFETRGSVNPHNFWIEILSQYGMVIFAGFCGWLVHVARVAWKARKRARRAQDDAGEVMSEIVLVGWCGYLFAAVANSSYMAGPTNWVYLASLLVMATHLYRRSGLAVPSRVRG